MIVDWINSPQSAETPSECEELKDLSLTPAIITGPARLHRISGSPIPTMPTMPTMPTIQAAQAAQAAQEKVLEVGLLSQFKLG